MSYVKRNFATSSNGDQWHLVCTTEARTPLVRHEPNAASGGSASEIDIASFLQRDPGAPQTTALLSLIEALILDGLEKSVGREAFLQKLRNAQEGAVEVALSDSKVVLPLTTAYEALEFFNCMLDIFTDQRTADLAAEASRIPAGFGSTQ